MLSNNIDSRLENACREAICERVIDRSKVQTELTQKHTDLSVLESFIRETRKNIDYAYQVDKERELKENGGHPRETAPGVTSIGQYPVGFCETIRDALLRELDGVAKGWYNPPAEFREMIQRFKTAGGVVKPLWGMVNTTSGLAFQNVIQWGNICIDGAYNTLDPTDDPVVIKPFDEYNFLCCVDFSTYAKTMHNYWHFNIHPTHNTPAVAPLVPFYGAQEHSSRKVGNRIPIELISLNLIHGLSMAEEFLNTPPSFAFQNPLTPSTQSQIAESFNFWRQATHNLDVFSDALEDISCDFEIPRALQTLVLRAQELPAT